MRRLRFSRAFTLVEMLLVVAVIVLLISLLLPALGRSKEMAKRSVCANNLHQIYSGLAAYILDSLGKYPGGNATLIPGNGIDSTFNVSQQQPMGLAFLITRGYATDAKLYYCPSWKHPWNQFDVVDVAGDDPWFAPNTMGGWPAAGKPGPTSHRGFAYHYRSTFGPAVNRPPSRKQPEAAIVADHWTRREVLYGRDFGHGDGYNTLFLDGRVTWKRDAMSQYMNLWMPGDGDLSKITNGKWALQEFIWQDFFER
ncbi:MAG: prepilin-type N-terminal cleavage/methylation domain-containing protein [Phycisphaeraceae bacterium]